MVAPQRLLVGIEQKAPPPASDSKSRGSGAYNSSSEANFDTNMVIILAALLCALICALGLNSIVRCALRCGRRIASPGEAAAVRLASTGLKKRVLRQIPVAVYGQMGVNIPATDCPICLGEFVDGEKVRVLPKCNHGFHLRCIDTWLSSHSSCPTCRHSLLERPLPSLDSGDVEAGTPSPSLGSVSSVRGSAAGETDEVS